MTDLHVGRHDLDHHGDAELAPGLLDLAVNVRAGTPPDWLRDRLRAAVDDVAAYPTDAGARAAVARRHGRSPDEVLITAGAAEAFVLIARALRPRHAVVVHPSFTSPEVALRHAGARVHRLLLPPPYLLELGEVPGDADLVVVGNPTNPTGVLHPRRAVAALLRRNRTVVVDEAFMDFAAGGTESMTSNREAVVVRSLTKMWGLAGLRVGYLLGPPRLVARLAAVRPPWPTSSLAAVAVEACLSADAVRESELAARDVAEQAAIYTGELARIPGVVIWPTAANFVLVQTPGRADLHGALRAKGFAVRRCDTFPGLGPDYLRVAVRDHNTNSGFAAALADLMGHPA
ncbi:MAG TPA: Rv2231c family pyridoxal phosphate-dependent protein CobC [Mycobacteriales bacterium]|nr:Rv2231c family pyridoxal phosphate-dependent protein CobC [Mycobacteriales bacterium]